MRETNFKQTELGLIPVDWEVCSFENFFDILPNSTFSRDKLTDSGNVMNIHYGDILTKYGEIVNPEKEEIPYLTDVKYAPKNLAKDGDIIIADTAEDDTVGACCEISRLHERKLIAGLHTIWARPKSAIKGGFLGYFMNFRLYHDQIIPLIQGVKVSSVSKSAIKKTFIGYPKSETEQINIGSALSNIDELILSLYKLIEKKLAIKAGAMSQLLSGKLRLPGFSEPWQRVTLDGVSQFANVTLPCDMFEDENYVCTENMIPDCGGIVSYDDIVPYMYAKSYVPFDILLSNIRPYLKKIWLADKAGCCSNDVLTIRPEFELISSHFLYYRISQDCFFNYVMEGVSGTKMPRGNKAHIAKYEFEIPSDLEEQKAIAKVLTDMDDEIAALEAKLKKYEQLKKGMMQQLLTGKIRLVSPNDSLS